MANKKITWQNCGLDLENIYFLRAGGESWEDLGRDNKISPVSLQRVVQEWAIAHEKPVLSRRIRLGYTILTDINMVDQGKAVALRKAGWPAKEIAIECKCDEEVMRRFLHDKALL